MDHVAVDVAIAVVHSRSCGPRTVNWRTRGKEQVRRAVDVVDRDAPTVGGVVIVVVEPVVGSVEEWEREPVVMMKVVAFR